ncbi:ATP-dependent DNA helicase PIF1-like protein [Tanacetum coccineum]
MVNLIVRFQQLIVGYDAKRTEVKEFTDWILDIGDGKVGGKNVGNAVVEFLEEWLIPDSTDHVGAVIQEIYLDLFLIL